MRFEVLLTADAERDMEKLYDFIAEHDSRRAADRVIYRVTERRIVVMVLPDGRRELGALLARRMLGA